MRKMLLLLSLSCLLTGAVYADTTLYFDHVNGTFAGHAYAAESYWGPYYISPYFGHTTGQTVDSTILFCIDFDHYINVPDQTAAVVRSLPATGFGSDPDYQFKLVTAGSGANQFISGALPTGANISTLTAFERYEAAIYLLNAELTLPGPPVWDSRKRALYQYAMWEMFLQNGPPDGNVGYTNALNQILPHDANFATDVNALVLTASSFVLNGSNQAYLNSLLPYFTVISSTDNPTTIGNKYQEFLSFSQIPPDLTRGAPVPEPSSVILFGTMLAGVGLVLRRRRA